MHSYVPAPRRRSCEPWEGPLAFAPPPAPGENIHGYVRRLALANGHTNVALFARAIGAAGIGPTSRDLLWERMARATGLPSATLDHMRWVEKPSGRVGRVDFLGFELMRGFLSPDHVRICPICLKIKGIHRDFWFLSIVAACPRHGTLLADACTGCGQVFSAALAGSPDRCSCGLPFSEMTTTPARPAALRVARNLALMIGASAVGEPDSSWYLELPPDAETLSLFDYLSEIEVVLAARYALSGSLQPVYLALEDIFSSSQSKSFAAKTRIANIVRAIEYFDRIVGQSPASLNTSTEEIVSKIRHEFRHRDGSTGLEAKMLISEIITMKKMQNI